MKLFKALALAEEIGCGITNIKESLNINPTDFTGTEIYSLPNDGWELETKATPTAFTTTFLGCDEIHNNLGESLGTCYSFAGKFLSLMPVGCKVTVTITPDE